jgi:hypothetical protein
MGTSDNACYVNSTSANRPPTGHRNGNKAAWAAVTPVEDANVARYRGQSGIASSEFGIRDVVPGSYIVAATAASGEKLAGFTRIRVPSVPNFFLTVRLALSPGLQVHGRLIGGSDPLSDFRRSEVALTSGWSALDSRRSVKNKRGLTSGSV